MDSDRDESSDNDDITEEAATTGATGGPGSEESDEDGSDTSTHVNYSGSDADATDIETMDIFRDLQVRRSKLAMKMTVSERIKNIVKIVANRRNRCQSYPNPTPTRNKSA